MSEQELYNRAGINHPAPHRWLWWAADRLYAVYSVLALVLMVLSGSEKAIITMILAFVLWMLTTGIYLEWRNSE